MTKFIYPLVLYHKVNQRIAFNQEPVLALKEASVSNFVDAVTNRMQLMGKSFIAENFIETIHMHHFVRILL